MYRDRRAIVAGDLAWGTLALCSLPSKEQILGLTGIEWCATSLRRRRSSRTPSAAHSGSSAEICTQRHRVRAISSRYRPSRGKDTANSCADNHDPDGSALID